MQEPQRAARVEERRHEQEAERQPDPGRVDLLGDRPLVAAGELRLHLVVAPRLVDRAVVRRRRSPARPRCRRRRSSTCQRSPRMSAVGVAPGLSASSSRTTSVASAISIASAGGDLESRRRHRLRRGLDQPRRQLAAERRLLGRVIGGVRRRARARQDARARTRAPARADSGARRRSSARHSSDSLPPRPPAKGGATMGFMDKFKDAAQQAQEAVKAGRRFGRQHGRHGRRGRRGGEDQQDRPARGQAPGDPQGDARDGQQGPALGRQSTTSSRSRSSRPAASPTARPSPSS